MTKPLPVNSNSSLRGKREEIRVKQNNISDLKYKNNQDRGQYDTLLLERIANQDDSLSLTDQNADNVKNSIDTNNQKIQILKNEIESLWGEIEGSSDAQNLIASIDANQPGIEKTKKKLEFWYPA